MNPFFFCAASFAVPGAARWRWALVLAFAGSLSPAVSMMERSIRSGMAQAADAFDLLVGAKGSAVDLVLGAVYLRPEPLPLLPLGTLEAVKAHGGVRWAAPLAFGDRWRDYPLAGTSSELVTLGGKRPLASGRMFLTGDEAVVGAGVPLKEGDVFSPSHGSVGRSRAGRRRAGALTIIPSAWWGACPPRARRGTGPWWFPSKRSGTCTTPERGRGAVPWWW